MVLCRHMVNQALIPLANYAALARHTITKFKGQKPDTNYKTLLN